MPGRAFFDTNVVVYAVDTRDPEKQSRAVELLSQNPDAVISTQVLIEWFNVVTRRLASPFSVEQAREGLAELLRWHVVPVETALVNKAVTLAERYQLSIWDAMVLAAAAKAGCEIVYSEDLNSGQLYDSVRVVNPFG